MTIAEKINETPYYKRIAALRALSGWSMEQAAEKCGTSQRIYWNWENGKCHPRRLFQKSIASAFGVATTEIFG